MVAVSSRTAEADDGFRARVDQAQRHLAAGIARAGLKEDAYQHVIAALSETVGLFPDMVAQINETHRPIDADRLRHAVAQGIHGHAAGLIRAFNLRTWVGAAGVILAALAIGAGGGYWFGESRGQTQGLSAVSVFAQLQPADAVAWADIIRYNPSGQQELTHCQRIADQGGRAVCQMNIWIDPPAPPRH